MQKAFLCSGNDVEHFAPDKTNDIRDTKMKHKNLHNIGIIANTFRFAYKI